MIISVRTDGIMLPDFDLMFGVIMIQCTHVHNKVYLYVSFSKHYYTLYLICLSYSPSDLRGYVMFLSILKMTDDIRQVLEGQF